MIPGFEDYTEDVKDEEIDIINEVARALNARIGKENAITNAKARGTMFLRTGISISDPKFRKYIQYIRIYNLCPMLCSSSKGYWIAKNKEEFIKSREAFAKRVRSMEFTKACMFHFDIENNILT